jgi:tRNA U34 5-carboxymethylaminomethyl modifying enzyme MnmG/GidA
MSIDINVLKERIESMSKYHQVEVLRLLNKIPSVKINENNNGTFVNLTEQTPEVLNELVKYANYVDEQQQQINKVENEKEKLEQTFFNN